MSHEIEANCMAYAGETPWHRLGVEVSPDLTPAEILEKAGLDWSVSLEPLTYVHERNGVKSVNTSSMKALVRSTDGQGADGRRSPVDTPIQNRDAFEVFSDFVAAGGMTMETAGSLRGGRLVWALARTTEEFRVFGGDVLQGYFLFSNPHEYGKTALFGGTSIRVVCHNTHSLALFRGTGQSAGDQPSAPVQLRCGAGSDERSAHPPRRVPGAGGASRDPGATVTGSCGGTSWRCSRSRPGRMVSGR